MRKVLLGASLLLLAGCYKKSIDKLKNVNAVKWSGTYAAPLVNMDLSLDDGVKLVKDFMGIGTYADGTIHLIYQRKEFSKYGSEIVVVPNQGYNFPDALNTTEATDLVNNNTVTVQRNYTEVFGTNDPTQEVDSINLSSGDLEIVFDNNYASAGQVTLTFPDLKNNGATADTTINFAASSTNNKVTMSLAGYSWNLSTGGSGYNHVRCQASVTYNYSGSPVLPGDNFVVNFYLKSTKWSKVFGYFGNYNLISASNNVELSIFNKPDDNGTFDFNDPKLKLLVLNGSGIPVALHTNLLKATRPSYPDIAITGYPGIKNVAAKTDASNSSKLRDSFLLVKGNSNIKNIIDQEYNYIEYGIDLELNPGGKTQRNFLLADSRIEVHVVQELPLTGTEVDVEIRDTSKFSLDLGGPEKYIEWVVLRISTDNGIPLQLGVQGYFMDSNYNALDSVFQPFRMMIPGANVDGSGNVTSPFTDQYDVKFDRMRIEHIRNAKYLLLKAIMLSSTNNGNVVPVRITKDQKLKFKMGVHSQLVVNERIGSK